MLASTIKSQNTKDHLIVLSHGLMGRKSDLNYLSEVLQKKGCLVLNSKSNEFLKTFNGVEKGAFLLVEEINEFKLSYPNLQRISFVGNSLGKI
jgi:hypothetical protein